MAKKPVPIVVTVNDIASFRCAGDPGDGSLYLELVISDSPDARKGTFYDLLHGAMKLSGSEGAYDAVKALLQDEKRLVEFVQAYLARKAVS